MYLRIFGNGIYVLVIYWYLPFGDIVYLAIVGDFLSFWQIMKYHDFARYHDFMSCHEITISRYHDIDDIVMMSWFWRWSIFHDVEFLMSWFWRWCRFWPFWWFWDFCTFLRYRDFTWFLPFEIPTFCPSTRYAESTLFLDLIFRRACRTHFEVFWWCKGSFLATQK